MKKKFSKFWKNSTQKRKQRKYVYNAPLNLRRVMMSARLSDELKKKYNRRSFPVKVGDVVELVTGQFKGTKGKVTKVMLNRYRVYVEKAEISKMDGTKTSYPIHPSNLVIKELNLEDDKRLKALNKKVEESK